MCADCKGFGIPNNHSTLALLKFLSVSLESVMRSPHSDFRSAPSADPKQETLNPEQGCELIDRTKMQNHCQKDNVIVNQDYSLHGILEGPEPGKARPRRLPFRAPSWIPEASGSGPIGPCTS